MMSGEHQSVAPDSDRTATFKMLFGWWCWFFLTTESFDRTLAHRMDRGRARVLDCDLSISIRHASRIRAAIVRAMDRRGISMADPMSRDANLAAKRFASDLETLREYAVEPTP